jgi:glycosyltransferase involved in cell wall biosynthesis
MIRSLSFLIPAYNDELTISTVVAKAQEVGKRLNIPFEIIVINDHSPDNLAQVLATLKKTVSQLKVITHAQNKGYGATIKELYLAGTKEWLFTIPGDYQVGAEELTHLLPLVNKADMILGRRTNRSDMPNRRRQSTIYNMLLQKLFRIPVHDANSVRLMRRSIMQTVRLTSTSAFVDAELVLRASKAGFCIAEAPITHRHRAGGSGQGGGGRLKTILPTIKDMIVFGIKQIT